MRPNVLNLFFLVFSQSESCDDPCHSKESCQTFVDSCPRNPSFNQVVGAFLTPINYIIRFDVFISDCGNVDGVEWKNIIEISEAGKKTYVEKEQIMLRFK